MRADAITVSFDAVVALDQVSITLSQGDLLGLIGPNGAGKTTLINVLSGVVGPQAGDVWLDDTRVSGWPMWRLARHGVARSFQGTRLFAGLSVQENLEIAGLGVGRRPRDARATAASLLEEARLDGRANQRASELPSGDQQRLGVLRALAMRPRFLLLDEPAAGLNEVESEHLVRTLRAVRDDYGCGILLVEHDMSVVMALCTRIQVLDYGCELAQGTPDEIRHTPAVLEAYLGAEYAQ